MVDDFNEKKIPLNILLVDDSDPDVRIALRAFARAKQKSNIYTVNDGQEALDFIYHKGKYQNHKEFPTPDLILLDIKMPKLGGFEVLKVLKSNIEYNFIPVIMLTSSKDEADIAKSYRLGAASFIQKAVNYEDFVKIVEGFNFYWYIVSRLPNQDKRS